MHGAVTDASSISIIILGFLNIYLSLLRHENSPIAFVRNWFIGSKYFGNTLVQTWLGLGCAYCFVVFWASVFCMPIAILEAICGNFYRALILFITAPIAGLIQKILPNGN